MARPTSKYAILVGDERKGGEGPWKNNPEPAMPRSGSLDIAFQVLGDETIDLVVVPPGLTIMDTAWDNDALSSFWWGLATFSRLILLDKRGTGLSDGCSASRPSKSGWMTFGW